MRLKALRSEKGQAMVEFALIIPLALLLLCAVIDYGWLFAHELVLSTAAREGARLGITISEDADFSGRVSNRVKNQASSICEPGNVFVTSSVSGDDVVVNVNYNLQMLTPMAPLIVGGMSYNIESSCTMKAE